MSFLNTKHQTPNTLTVTRTPSLIVNGKEYPCVIGKHGFAEPGEKREGDNKTPIGTFPLRFVCYRPDRFSAPATGLPLFQIEQNAGWCDDPADPHYNQPVILPYAASHEKMWREDHCYDLLVVIGYNDAPAIPGKGSAIFIHCEHDDARPTAGCVALKKNDLAQLLPLLNAETLICLGEP